MPTSWNVTPHRDEHGYPATMTGDDGMRVLGLNLDSPYSTCTEIMVKNGRGWLEGRLQHYQDLSDELFRPEGKELAEAPTRDSGGASGI